MKGGRAGPNIVYHSLFLVVGCQNGVRDYGESQYSEKGKQEYIPMILEGVLFIGFLPSYNCLPPKPQGTSHVLAATTQADAGQIPSSDLAHTGDRRTAMIHYQGGELAR